MREGIISNLREDIKKLNESPPISFPVLAYAAMVPYTRVPMHTPGSLFLGNDTFRAELGSYSGSNLQTPEILREVGIKILSDFNDRMLDFYGIKNYKLSSMPEIDRQPDTLQNCTLLISVNDLTQTRGNDYNGVEVKGLDHIYAGISENDVDLYPAIFNALYNGSIESCKECKVFTNLFQRMYDVLLTGKDVFIHCNNGEHRSAGLTVLFLCWIAKKNNYEVGFNQAHKYVAQFRPIIKPLYIETRVTLMTEFYRLHRDLGSG